MGVPHISFGFSLNHTVRTRKRRIVMQRRRSAPHTFEDNIAAEKAKLEAQLAALKPGPQMDALRKKIRQLDTASHMSEWLSSPGLQAPT
jgi:hypothetical protein